MLDLTIYSYGYSEIIFHTMQAIAMFRNSDFYIAVISAVSLLAGLTYALYMIAARGEGEWKQYLKKIIGMVVFINALLFPTATMSVKDNVTKQYWEVDNIPLAFALPIGIVENFGHILTYGFEQAFSLVGGNSSHSYYHYGSVFGARLQKEVLQAKVRDPEFISNMANFIERCVILPSQIGKQFTKEELVASEDMWGLIKEKAGTFTRTPMTIDGNRVNPHPKCKDAIPYFEAKFEEAIGLNIASLAWKFMGAGKDVEHSKGTPGTRALNQNIKAQITALYGTNHQVDTILKHNMMINSINSYRSGKYPAAKAAMHAEAGGFISGDLAEKTLTGSLAVMKVILYGSYIFLFPLLLLSGGIAKYRSWITAAFSLVLWPSFFSMLNMIIDFAYQPSTIVSYSSWATEVKKFDSIASTAANLTIMIPFLSFWITRMAEGGFMHLAGSIMATSNSASAVLAGEKASGSRSWDNESIRNQNNDNVSSYKHDSSMQYVSGAARSQMADGSMETITAGGSALYFSGSGQTASSGESSYRQSGGIAANYQVAVRDETQVMSSEQASYTKSQEKLFAQEASALYSIMENTKTDTGYNIDTSTESGKERMKAMNAIDELNKTNDDGWKQNAEAHMKADYVAGGVAAKAFGFEVGAGGSITSNNESSQSDSQSNRLSEENSVHARDANSQRTNKSENILNSLGIDKNTQDSIRESYQETQRLEKSIAAHKDKIDSYNKAIDYTSSNSSEFSKDMYQDVVDRYQEKYGGSAREAHEAVSSGSTRARAIHRELTASDAQAVFNKISNKGREVMTSNNVNDFVQNNPINTDIGKQRDNFAKNNNIRIDKDNVTKEISNKGKDIEELHTKEYKQNEEKYKDTEYSNTQKQIALQTSIDQHERNRIGRNGPSSLIGGVGRPSPTQNELDFEQIARPYDPTRPPGDEFFDKAEAQNLMNSTISGKHVQGPQGKTTVKDDGQYVNPKG